MDTTSQTDQSGGYGGADGGVFGHSPNSTTLGTIVVQGGPLQLVIAVLQVSIYFTNDDELQVVKDNFVI